MYNRRRGIEGLWGGVVPFDSWLLHPRGWTGVTGPHPSPNSHMLVPRAIPWDLASAEVIRFRVRVSVRVRVRGLGFFGIIFGPTPLRTKAPSDR